MPIREVPIGKNCVLVYEADATEYAAPTWVAIENAVDVSQPGISKTSVDLPSRGTSGWNLKGAGLKGMDLQFGYLYESGTDAILADLRDSFLNDTPMIFGVLDGPTGGVADRAVQGFYFVGTVFEFPINQELEDGERLDIKVEAVRYRDPTAGTLRLPAWMTIAAT